MTVLLFLQEKKDFSVDVWEICVQLPRGTVIFLIKYIVNGDRIKQPINYFFKEQLPLPSPLAVSPFSAELGRSVATRWPQKTQ